MIADATVNYIPWSNIEQAMLAIGFDLAGGLFVGGLFWKPLSRVSISKITSEYQQRWVLLPEPGDPVTNFRLGVRGIVTGFAALQACFAFGAILVSAIFVTFAILLLIIDPLEEEILLAALLAQFLPTAAKGWAPWLVTLGLFVLIVLIIYLAYKLCFDIGRALLLYRPVQHGHIWPSRGCPRHAQRKRDMALAECAGRSSSAFCRSSS